MESFIQSLDLASIVIGIAVSLTALMAFAIAQGHRRGRLEAQVEALRDKNGKPITFQISPELRTLIDRASKDAERAAADAKAAKDQSLSNSRQIDTLSVQLSSLSDRVDANAREGNQAHRDLLQQFSELSGSVIAIQSILQGGWGRQK